MADVRPLLALAFVAGCAKSVVPEYEARRAAVLGTPTEVPARWRPDGVLRLSEPLVDELIGKALTKAGTFQRRVELGGRAHFTPDLSLTSLELSPSASCRSCLHAEVELAGKASWSLGNSKGERRLGGSLAFDAEVIATREGATWVVGLRPQKVTRADLEMEGKTFRTVAKLADAAIQDWASQHVFDELPPLVLSRHEGADLPLRAVRAVVHDDGVDLQLLSEAPIVELVDPEPLRPGETWSLALSQAALLHVARRKSFERGAVSHDVVVEPTALRLGDGTFEADLRLWRPKGRGWWRDVTVEGTWLRTPEGFDLAAVEAEEVARSKGARTVDPLAALAEGTILHAVEEAVTTSIPGGHGGDLAGIPVKARVDRVTGGRTSLAVGGVATVDGVAPKPASPRRVGP